MKAKRFVLLVLVLATLFSAFAVSCRKKPTATNDPEPTVDPKAADDYKDFDFSLKENGLYLVEIPAEKKASFQKETLIIPGFFTGEELPVPVEELGSYACQGLTTLKKVTVSYPISVIGGQAFAECTSLTSVELPNSLEQIKVWAFEHCTSLTEITYHGTISAWNGIIINAEWIDAGKTITIHCSNGDVTVTRPQTQSE